MLAFTSAFQKRFLSGIFIIFIALLTLLFGSEPCPLQYHYWQQGKQVRHHRHAGVRHLLKTEKPEQ